VIDSITTYLKPLLKDLAFSLRFSPITSSKTIPSSVNTKSKQTIFVRTGRSESGFPDIIIRDDAALGRNVMEEPK